MPNNLCTTFRKKQKTTHFLVAFIILMFLPGVTFGKNLKPRPMAPQIGFNGSLDLSQAVMAADIKQDSHQVIQTDDIVDQETIDSLKAKLSSLNNTNPVQESDLLIFDNIEGSTNVEDLNKNVDFTRDNIKNIDFNNSPAAIIIEMQDNMSQEEFQVLEHLRILWQSAVEKSETIRFAIQKLSGADQKPGKENSVKSTVSSVASMLPVLGVMSGSAVAGGGAIMGGNFLGSIMNEDSKKVNSYLTRVSDADLVLLAKEIDSLQKTVIEKYYDYRNAVERLKLAQQIVQNRYKEYNAVIPTNDKQLITITDSFFKEALQAEYDAKQTVLSARASLEQLTSSDSIKFIDTQLMGSPS